MVTTLSIQASPIRSEDVLCYHARWASTAADFGCFAVLCVFALRIPFPQRRKGPQSTPRIARKQSLQPFDSASHSLAQHNKTVPEELNQMKRTIFQATMLAVVLGLAMASTAAAQDFQKTYRIGAGGQIRVGNISGDVIV